MQESGFGVLVERLAELAGNSTSGAAATARPESGSVDYLVEHLAELAGKFSRLQLLRLGLQRIRDRWPASWVGVYRDPVVALRLALYGHPDSGALCKQHCEERMLLKDIRTIPGWPGFLTHEALRVVVDVYVKDFQVRR